MRRRHADLPGEIKRKRTLLVAEEQRFANYVRFIGEGKGTPAVAEALKTAEARAQALREELGGLEPGASPYSRRSWNAIRRHRRRCCAEFSGQRG